ncbi:BspA family leucine-rich repeat surface protein [Muricauda sp. HICW]|uniref:BspA family leucine-rich repeat surface protein n=1 Tax=Flagellimonas chongwuensis TaxID=2697365 RepID=A0A850NFL3_9FLAO|nr:cadherin domain-containing protein [Allomuricauda chongwuensis]NVN17700.1 BspA family leucine-rich repeat surface protein [Allomuricauda chongwuensis]
MKKLFFSILAVAMFWSCGKDDSPETPTPPTPTETENSVPVIAAKTFTVSETISDTEVIGKVTATDADDDTLTFSIATNSDALFEITATGDLSLASGKTLDAATKEQHAITVKVDDGEDTASATVTIKVTSEEVIPTNEAPEMADQNFSIMENHVAGESMGAIEATDADGDALTFELTENDNDLFAVSESGVLTLAEGKTLDFETETSHSIIVSVTDGKETVDATITITVENVIESIAEDPASFVTTWKTEADGEEVKLYFEDIQYEYDFMVDWGDGTIENITTIPPDQILRHGYENPGVYTVAIKGEMQMFLPTSSNMLSMEQWGSIVWQELSYAFADQNEMVYNATDSPDLSNVTSLEGMFLNAISFNGDIGGWNIGNVEFMESMLDNTGMSLINFSNTLVGWSAQDVQPNVYLGAAGLFVCFNDASGLAAFTTLASEPNNWEFVWDGLKNCN